MKKYLLLILIPFLIAADYGDSFSNKASKIKVADIEGYYASPVTVESALQQIGSGSTESDPLSLHLAGGTMTGAITLANIANPLIQQYDNGAWGSPDKKLTIQAGATSASDVITFDAFGIYESVPIDYQVMILAETGLVSYWKMDDDWTDSKDSNDGTANGATFGTAKYGTAAGSFDGNSDATMGTAILGFTSAVSVEAWIKETGDNTNGAAIVDNSGGSWSNGYGLAFTEPNTIIFFINSGWGGNEATATLVNDGEWHHIVGTYDGVTIRIYVDGVEGTPFPYSTAITPCTTAFKLGDGGGGSFTGLIDEAAVYDIALPSETILAHFIGTLPPFRTKIKFRNSGTDYVDLYVDGDVNATEMNATDVFADNINADIINLPTTTATKGIIYRNSIPFIHGYGTTNIFLGAESGNFTMTGYNNSAVGNRSLKNNTSGYGNVALGQNSLHKNTTGFYNTAIGESAMYNNDNGRHNMALGYGAMVNKIDGIYNTAIGAGALSSNSYGNYNLALGAMALYYSTGDYNIAIGGYNAGQNITTGSYNIIIGNVDAPVADGSYQLNIGNTIYGDLSLAHIGVGISPTAVLHLKAGTATASTAPLKFSAGTPLTTPEEYVLEPDGDTLLYTIPTGAARKTIAFLESPLFTTPDIGVAIGTSLSVSGDIKNNTAGGGFYVKEGTNATMGVATLVAGTVTVSTTKVTANSRIFLTPQTLGTILKPTGVGVTARTAGTSFVITSMDITDTSTVGWLIMEPS